MKDAVDILNDRIAKLEAENERLREVLKVEWQGLIEDNKILSSEVEEYKNSLQDARHVIKEAVERIKPLWPFVAEWLPDTADRFEARMNEDSNNARND